MNSTTQSNRIKRGEIYQLPNDKFTFVCVHCLKEFKHFTEFTLHIQNHLHSDLQKVVLPKDFQACSVELVKIKNYSPNSSIEGPLIHSNDIKVLEESDDDFEFTNLIETEYKDESSRSTVDNTKKKTTKTHRFECFICNKKLASAYGVKRHLKVHKYADLQCKLCDASFRTSRYLERHMAALHPTSTKFVSQLPITEAPIEKSKIYQCKYCQKIYRDRRQLHNHQTSHKQSPCLCLICGKLFSGERTLSRHMELHSSDEKHSCSECGRTFKQRRYLLEHKRKVHNNSGDGQVTCEICNEQFENRRSLQIHKQSHPYVEKRNFPCTICSFAAKCAYDLRRHTETHNVENRSFECEICHKKLLPRYANSHMKSHDSTRNFECTECGQRFKRGSALKRHQVLHQITNGNGPAYNCDVCSKAFPRMDGLLRHRRRHGVAMNFHCRICNKGFIEQKSYLFHEASHTKGNVKTEQNSLAKN